MGQLQKRDDRKAKGIGRRTREDHKRSLKALRFQTGGRTRNENPRPPGGCHIKEVNINHFWMHVFSANRKFGYGLRIS